MILRDKGCVFVHVPKTAGSSLSRALTDCAFDPGAPPNYDLCWGWCPIRQVWLQHLTLQQMVDYKFVSRQEVDSLFIFAIVRNPYSRVLSDFYFLRRNLEYRGSFADMLEAHGPWRALLSDRTTSSYRGDHPRAQIDYVTLDGKVAVDHVGRHEALDGTLAILHDNGIIQNRTLPRSNTQSYRFQHYSHFYSNQEIRNVTDIYGHDLSSFGYSFFDQRTLISRTQRPYRRWVAGLHPGTRRKFVGYGNEIRRRFGISTSRT
jgi:hypothetical protein